MDTLTVVGKRVFRIRGKVVTETESPNDREWENAKEFAREKRRAIEGLRR